MHRSSYIELFFFAKQQNAAVYGRLVGDVRKIENARLQAPMIYM